jgi:5,10-methenyltetrahydrofolate synthetase
MTTSLPIPPLEPSRDKKTLRRQLQAERQSLVDRHERAMHLQQVLRVFLATRQEQAIGAYWPIKGEFDALPALYRWSEADDKRRIGLPVVHKDTKQLRFHVWYPGCAMEEGAFKAYIPVEGAWVEPEVVIVPLVAFDGRGFRLGYGGGFYDRTLEGLRAKRPTIAVGFAFDVQEMAQVPIEDTDQKLDFIVTESGVRAF